MSDTIVYALEMLGQGMLGIFVVLGLMFLKMLADSLT